MLVAAVPISTCRNSEQSPQDAVVAAVDTSGSQPAVDQTSAAPDAIADVLDVETTTDEVAPVRVADTAPSDVMTAEAGNDAAATAPVACELGAAATPFMSVGGLVQLALVQKQSRGVLVGHSSPYCPGGKCPPEAAKLAQYQDRVCRFAPDGKVSWCTNVGVPYQGEAGVYFGGRMFAQWSGSLDKAGEGIYWLADWHEKNQETDGHLRQITQVIVRISPDGTTALAGAYGVNKSPMLFGAETPRYTMQGVVPRHTFLANSNSAGGAPPVVFFGGTQPGAHLQSSTDLYPFGVVDCGVYDSFAKTDLVTFGNLFSGLPETVTMHSAPGARMIAYPLHLAFQDGDFCGATVVNLADTVGFGLRAVAVAMHANDSRVLLAAAYPAKPPSVHFGRIDASGKFACLEPISMAPWSELELGINEFMLHGRCAILDLGTTDGALVACIPFSKAFSGPCGAYCACPKEMLLQWIDGKCRLAGRKVVKFDTPIFAATWPEQLPWGLREHPFGMVYATVRHDVDKTSSCPGNPSAALPSDLLVIRMDHWANQTCASSGPCWQKTYADCIDTNPCTSDLCDAAHGGCFHEPLPNGTLCAAGKKCQAGVCQ